MIKQVELILYNECERYDEKVHLDNVAYGGIQEFQVAMMVINENKNHKFQ
jgi:hypothetical protein